jgi:hypothetical protein
VPYLTAKALAKTILNFLTAREQFYEEKVNQQLCLPLKLG